MSDINIAIRAGDIDEVVRYIENGGDITKDFNYCIRAAAEKGYVNIVKLLLENGADCNEGSYSATTNACMRGHIDTLNILLEHGGDIFKDDNSSIKLASYYGYFDMVKLLLKLGVDCTTENNAAIRNAHTNNHSNVVELLSEYGARLPKERNRGFELVSKYENEFVFTMNEFNKEFDAQKGRDGVESVKRLFTMPARGTKKSACYDIFNNTGEDIVLAPGELSGAITTYLKAYMLDDEVLMAYVRSGHGFKFSVRLANSTGIIDCVPKGTKIKTPSGDINVEDLFDNRVPIYSYNEEKHIIEEDSISDMWIVDDKELIEFELESGDSIKIPHDKEVFTKRGWVRASSLNMTDEVLTY